MARRDVLRAGCTARDPRRSRLGRSPLCSAARRRPPKPRHASWSWSSCPAPMTGSTPSCRMATTPITGRGQRSASAPDKLRKLDDHFGLQPTMAGFERLYKDGHLAIVHGVGYDHPSFSHFSSMAYWQTARAEQRRAYGWVGRLADAMDPRGTAQLPGRHRHPPVARGARAQPRAAGVRRSRRNSRAGGFSTRERAR